MAVLRYALILICLIFVVSGLAAVLQAGFDIHLGAASTGVVPVLMAAMIEGQGHFKRLGTLPETRQKLRFAAMATAVNLALLGPLLVLKSLGDPGFETMLRGFDAVLWSVILGGLVAITLPASFLFYGFGASNLQKTQARLKAKAGTR